MKTLNDQYKDYYNAISDNPEMQYNFLVFINNLMIIRKGMRLPEKEQEKK